MAGVGFGARDLVYLLVAAFGTAAALDFGQQPHGITDAAKISPILSSAAGVTRWGHRNRFGLPCCVLRDHRALALLSRQRRKELVAVQE
jgi:hypothetical protein